jgi:hypothetical protein
LGLQVVETTINAHELAPSLIFPVAASIVMPFTKQFKAENKASQKFGLGTAAALSIFYKSATVLASWQTPCQDQNTQD